MSGRRHGTTSDRFNPEALTDALNENGNRFSAKMNTETHVYIYIPELGISGNQGKKTFFFWKKKIFFF